jgi:hypothetical protein
MIRKHTSKQQVEVVVPENDTLPGLATDWLRVIESQVRTLRFGSTGISIHDGRVVGLRAAPRFVSTRPPDPGKKPNDQSSFFHDFPTTRKSCPGRFVISPSLLERHGIVTELSQFDVPKESGVLILFTVLTARQTPNKKQLNCRASQGIPIFKTSLSPVIPGGWILCASRVSWSVRGGIAWNRRGACLPGHGRRRDC